MDETGETFEENAFLSRGRDEGHGPARGERRPGLEVDALAARPAYSEVYGQPRRPDLDRRKFLMKNLEGEEHRTARLSQQYAVCSNGDAARPRHLRGPHRDVHEGRERLATTPCSSPTADRTTAEMTHEEKNEISHRGAPREFARVLKEYCNADK
ncbi:MAG: non-canonical purine NTP pyrophosphatase [Oscillospiraceae bacterium]